MRGIDMQQPADTLVDDLKNETSERTDLTTSRRAETTIPSSSASASSTVTSKKKRSFSQRIKNMFSSLTKALEGDHEFHNYLGG
jgi:hypothetical protein